MQTRMAFNSSVEAPMPQRHSPPTGSRPLRITTIAIAASLAMALPATGQQAKAPKTQVWMDVATHDMAGMPDMGGLGRTAMGMFGGANMRNHYGATRYGAMPGRYVDIALLNQLNPGVEAEDLVPAGLRLGSSLPLLPPKSEVREPAPSGERGQMRDSTTRILIYWGCGTSVRPGQPKEIRIDVKEGQVKTSGAMQGRYVPDRTANPTPSYALWPNERNNKAVPDGASLVGQHRISGAKVPESLRFTLEQSQDFMPKIALASSGDLDNGQTWSWQPLPMARGYFLHDFGMKDDEMVLWSSSETADVGMGVLDYLPPATIDRWIREKVLLPASATSCAMPKGIFAGADHGRSGGGMMRMIAYGTDSNIAWPPKPANPKLAWNPEWNVRVRTKSTTTAMLGMDMAALQQGTPQQPQEKKPLKKLLKGLLGH
jgi:hypothetical protein